MTNKTTETRDALYPEYVRFLSDDEIHEVMSESVDCSYKQGLEFAREIEAMVASRCRAQGGVTSDNNDLAAANKAAEEGDLDKLLSRLAFARENEPPGGAREAKDAIRAYIAADRAARPVANTRDGNEFYQSWLIADPSGAVERLRAAAQALLTAASKKIASGEVSEIAAAADAVDEALAASVGFVAPVANKAEVEPAAPIGAVPSIDTPEFCDLITESHCAMDEVGNEARSKTWAALIAHIDQHVASQVRAATGARAVLTDEQLRRGLQALLQCTASELDDYSLKLMDGYEGDVRRVHSALVAAQAGQVAVPAGFVLVPESPTAEMFEAASVPRRLNWDSLSIWKAMVEAAPSPASESLRSPQEAAGTEKGVRDACA